MNSRREFFRRASQLLMLSGLVGGTAYLVTRNGISDSCADNQFCKSCTKLNSCSLDKAEKYKRSNDRFKK